MKINFNFFIFFTLFVRISSAAEDYKITMLSCISVAQHTTDTKVCEWNGPRLSLGVNITKPWNNFLVDEESFIYVKYFILFLFQVKIYFFRLTDGNFLPMFNSPIIDWCSFMSGKAKVSSFVKMFLTSFKMTMPHFIHNCPYLGFYSATNISLPRQFLTFYPTGVFRIKARAYIKDEDYFIFRMDYTTY